MPESVLIFRNSSLKLKTVADNAENVSRCVKSKIENGFYLTKCLTIHQK